MRINHCRADVRVAQQLLHGPDIVSVLHEMRRERVPQRVASRGLREAGFRPGVPERPLKDRFMKMVAPSLSCLGVGVVARRRKDPLPAPVLRSFGVFAGQRERELHRAQSPPEVFFVQGADLGEVKAQRLAQGRRQRRQAVLVPFAGAHDDLVLIEVDVLHAQTAALHQSQSRTVEQGGHETGRSRHHGQDAAHLVFRQDDGQAERLLRADDSRDPPGLAAEAVLEVEEESVEGLVLGRGADFFFDDEVGQEAGYVLLRCLSPGEPRLESADPAEIGVHREWAHVARLHHFLSAEQRIDGRGRTGRPTGVDLVQRESRAEPLEQVGRVGQGPQFLGGQPMPIRKAADRLQPVGRVRDSDEDAPRLAGAHDDR